MAKKREPTPQELLFVSHYVAGKTAVESARLAGYSPETARHSAFRLMRRPVIAEAIEEARANIRAEIGYTLEIATAEADAAIAEARAAKQYTAVSSLLQHKAKLYGLLVDRVAHLHAQIDLLAARDEGLARIAAWPPARPAGRIIDAATIFDD